MVDRRKIPRRVATVNVTRLPLSPTDGYVLAQVDGGVGVDEIADLVGLAPEAVEQSLARLVELGAVTIEEEIVHRSSRPPRDLPFAPTMPVMARPPFASASSPHAHTPPPRSAAALPPPPSAAAPSPAAASEPVERRAPPLAEEEVDLDEDRKRLILETHAHLEEYDYYELLRVSQSAEKAEIKAAYFQLSKVFHPDTAYGKRLGSYKAKMEAVFRRLTEAHDALSRAKRRAEYDEELASRGKVPRRLPPLAAEVTRPGVAVGASTSAPAGAASPSTSVVAPSPSIPPPGASAPSSRTFASPPASSPRIPVVPPAASTERGPAIAADATRSSGAAAQVAAPAPAPASVPSSLRPPTTSSLRPATGAFGTTLRGASTPSSEPGRPARASASEPARPAESRPSSEPARPSTAPTSQPARPVTTPIPDRGAATSSTDAHARPVTGASMRPPDHVLRGLATSLKHASAVTGSQDRIDRHLVDARRAERDGDVAGALNTIRLARQLAPERADVAAEYERLNRAHASSTAPDNEAQALAEEKAGRWASASIAWGKVCEGRPQDVRALRRAAHSLLEAKGDLRRARGYAQRAVDLAPNDFESVIVLARVYMAAGMKLNAQRELEAASRLNPSDPIVKTLLRELKSLP